MCDTGARREGKRDRIGQRLLRDNHDLFSGAILKGRNSLSQEMPRQFAGLSGLANGLQKFGGAIQT